MPIKQRDFYFSLVHTKTCESRSNLSPLAWGGRELPLPGRIRHSPCAARSVLRDNRSDRDRRGFLDDRSKICE